MGIENIATSIAFGAAQFAGARSADVPNFYGAPLSGENPHTIFEEGYGLDTMYPQAQTVPCTIPDLEAAYPEEMAKLSDAAQRLALGDGVVTPAGLGTFAGSNVAAACPNGLAGVEAAYGGETQSNPIVSPQQNVPAPLEIAPTSVPGGDGVIDPESPYADSLPILGYYAAGILGLTAAGFALLRRSEQTEVSGSVSASPKKEQIKHNPWREKNVEPPPSYAEELRAIGKKLIVMDEEKERSGQPGYGPGEGFRWQTHKNAPEHNRADARVRHNVIGRLTGLLGHTPVDNQTAHLVETAQIYDEMTTFDRETQAALRNMYRGGAGKTNKEMKKVFQRLREEK